MKKNNFIMIGLKTPILTLLFIVISFLQQASAEEIDSDNLLSRTDWAELESNSWTAASSWNPGVGHLTSVAIHPFATTSYGLEFSSPIIIGNKFRVNLRLTSSIPFNMGSSNLRFNFNTLALSSPVIYSDAFPSPDFSTSTTTGTNFTTGIASINTVYNGVANASTILVPVSGIDVLTVEFNIINPSLMSGLVWRITSGLSPRTTLLDDDKITTVLQNSNIVNLNIPLQGVNAGQDVSVNCSNPSTSLTATGATSYLWSTGETSASINVSPSITTTYSITATSGVLQSVDEVIVVSDKIFPTANAGIDVTVNCINPSTILSATGNGTYTWSNGANQGDNVTPAVTTTYTVTVTATNGCTASASTTVFTDKLPPTTNAGADVTVNCISPSSTLNAAGGVSYQWSDGLLQGSTITPLITTTYSVTATGNNGCTAADDVIVFVNRTAPPVQIIANNPTLNCSLNNTNLDAFTMQSSWASSYLWDTGATVAILNVNPTSTTTYHVTITGIPGCVSVGSASIIVDNTPPTANAGANVTVNCTNPSTTTTATGDGTYAWSNGATQGTAITPSSTTTYIVTVTGTNGCTATASKIVTVDKNPPTASAGSNRTIGLGSSTTLTASGGGTYLWSNGANSASITVNPIVTTTYSVTVTGTNGCTAVSSVVVTVSSSPTYGLEFSSPVIIGVPTNKFRVNLRLSSIVPFNVGSTNFRFNFNQLALSNPVIISDIFPSSSGFGTTTTTGTSNSTGIASINTTYNGAANASTILVPVSGIDVVTLEFDIINPTLMTGLYWRLTSSANPRTTALDDDKVTTLPQNSNIVNLNIPLQGANAGVDVTVSCNNPSVTLTATGGANYLWSTGETSASISVSPSITTTYSVTATTGTFTSIDNVTVFSNSIPPTANAGADETVNCTNPSTTLLATATPSAAATFVWDNGATQGAIVSPTATTTYTVTVTGGNGCTATANKIVTVDSTPPAANAGADIIIGTGASTTLTATGGVNYFWNTGATTASTIVTPVNQITTYTVTVTGVNGCTASDDIKVTIINTVSYGLAFSCPVVAGNKFRVNLSINALNSFYLGANNLRFNYNTLALANPVIIFENFPSPDFGMTTTLGTNPVTGIVSINTPYSGATNANILLISTTYVDLVSMEFDIINPNLTSNMNWRSILAPAPYNANPRTAILDDDKLTPIVANYNIINLDVPLQGIYAGADVSINCNNPSTILSAIGGTNYLWSNGATTASINVSPSITTTYNITATNGIVKSIDNVTVFADKIPPIANAGADISTDCQGNSVALTANGGTSYAWSNGENVAAINVNPTITTTYIVTVTAPNGCVATDDVLVLFRLCYPIVNAKVFLNYTNSTTLMMDAYLKTLPTFPVTDPYAATPFSANFTHVNNTINSTTTTVLANTGNNAIIDWLFLELRTGTSGSTSVAYTKAALLQADGDIVDMNGTSYVTFTNAVPGNYYLTIRHRNHLGFRTANTAMLTGIPTTFDFTKIIGTNTVPLHGVTPLFNLTSDIYTMIGGDANSDGSCDALDSGSWENQNGAFDDYSLNADFNMDGSVDALDSAIWELQNGKYQEVD